MSSSMERPENVEDLIKNNLSQFSELEQMAGQFSQEKAEKARAEAIQAISEKEKNQDSKEFIKENFSQRNWHSFLRRNILSYGATMLRQKSVLM